MRSTKPNRHKGSSRRLRIATPAALALAGCLLFGANSQALDCEGGTSNGGVVLTSITLDGDPSDWAPVLAGGVQVTVDGDGSSMDPADCGALSTDRDCYVGQAGRDMNRFTWTYDDDNVYLYQTRYGSESNIQTFFFYMDLDLDRHMGLDDYILKVDYWGSNRKTKFQLFRFIPVDGITPDPMECPAGDPTCDEGYADGYAMPGGYAQINDPLCETCTARTAYYGFNVNGTGYGLHGEGFEVGIPWSDLGFTEPAAIYFHVSGTNPAGIILDNCGNPDGKVGYFGFHGADIEPYGSSSMGVPAFDVPVPYSHTVTNGGLFDDDVLNLAASSSMGFRIDLYDDGTNTLMGTDANGDGDFTDPGDYLADGSGGGPDYDTDGDGFPDTGPMPRYDELDPGTVFPLRVEVTVPAGTAGQDETVVQASVSGYDSKDCVVDTTTVGDVDVAPDRSLAGMPGSAVDFGHSVTYYGDADAVNLYALSTMGWRVEIWSDIGGDGVPDFLLGTDSNGDGTFDSAPGDTNGDGLPDTGSLSPGTPWSFVVRVTAGAGAGDTDSLAVHAVTTGVNGYAGDTCRDELRVANRISITPDHLIADGENFYGPQGYSVFIPHAVENAWSEADAGVFSEALTEDGTPVAWDVAHWSDPDCDGNISDGKRLDPKETAEMAANGGIECVVAELLIPTSAADGAVVRMDVTATSKYDSDPVPAADTARDELIVSQLVTFATACCAVSKTSYTTCDTIWAKGFNWTPGDVYFVHFFDGDGIDASGAQRLVVNGLGEFVGSHPIDPATDAPGTWAIQLRDIDDVTVLKTVSISVTPLAPAVTGPVESCAREVLTLEAQPGFSAYSWSPGGQTSRIIVVAPEATTTYTCTVTDENGCQGTSADHTVTVGNCVNLLRNADKVTLDSPPDSAIFQAGEPALVPGRDDEVLDFASGTLFPHDTLDLESSACPLIFYELEGVAGDTLRITKSGGRIVITY